ncbi:unnamed protein product [Didymodactylos carnosus]|uniref:Uncharacterized protein n=1 Tax=Didymodactylos carnosus TaxID=1234261 RepID=A0A8S2HDC4_9BILA|nr:unnamed protein product [Didymodactylos carnosus]CAF3631778.1 unnamed protein product [Didymodactylos carnosus]
MIYYRLSYLNKQRGNLRASMNYIDLAKRKYNEKINKSIFDKINQLKSELSLLEKRPLNFMEKNQLNLIQICNLIIKFQSHLQLSLINGFQWFSNTSNRNSIIDCLFYHLIEDANDIDQFLTDNVEHSLTQTFKELQKMLKEISVDDHETLTDIFNDKFHTKFQCLLINKNINSFDDKRIPIILRRHSETNRYQTIKQINYKMFLVNLVTTYDAKKDLKSVCSKFLNEEIGKNILIDKNENKTIDWFIKSMINCETMKIFTENIVYYLTSDDYNKNCFDFWSSIADFQYHIDLEETLNHFKQLFLIAIEEHREEEEEKHRSALELIDDIIEQNQNQQKIVNLIHRLKEEILRSLSQYENVSSNSRIREKINKIISSKYKFVDKIQKLISNECLNIDLQFKDSETKVQFYEYLQEPKQNDIVYQIFLMIEEILAKPKIQINRNTVIVESFNIILSDLIVDLEKKFNKSKMIKEMKFYATNVFIDHSLINDYWHGVNLIFISNTIHFVKDASNNKITLDVSGRKGQDGTDAQHQPHTTRPNEDGLDGLPGGNGEAGHNGGHIYLIAKSLFKGKENLEKLITSGGAGGKGGNGGNAGNGSNGTDGENATETQLPPLIKGYSVCWGKEGARGGNGGVGGNAGLGGFGGHAGLVYIEENQTNITDAFTSLIESIDRSNINGEDGKPGQGGKGGTGGRDGYDFLQYRLHGFGSAVTVRGSINWRGADMGWLKVSVDFTCDEPSKKPDGINHGAGKTANEQLESGKTRNKREKKNQLSEEKMKSELNEIIHRHNEISNSLSNSMNLFKDQMNDMLDERQSRVKTHALSDSMLEHAHQIAQQALAENAIKMKSKVESTNLKTCEMDSKNHYDKLLIQTRLKFDDSKQEIIQPQKLNIITDLQRQYKQKNQDFRVQLNKDLDKIRHEIKSLKSKGKHIFFRIDIDNLSATFLSMKSNENQIDLEQLFKNESESNSLFNQNFSSLSDNFQRLSYDPITKRYEPFLLNEYFEELKQLKRKKRMIIRMKNQLSQLNIEEFIENSCLEFGNEEIIKRKLSGFDEIFSLNIIDRDEFFNIDDFIKEISSSVDSSNDSELVADGFLSEKINKKSKFKQAELHQCSPIYHQRNEQQIIEIHPIEELIIEFLDSKEKNLELIVRMLNSLSSIFQKKQFHFLCQTKLKKFIEFLSENVLFIRTDFNSGHLFRTMKRILNSIQLHHLTSLFNDLKSVILFKEKQFNEFQKCLDKIQIFFQHKQNDFDQEIRMLNYIRKNRKSDIFDLFKNCCQPTATLKINQYENVQQFINNLYLRQEFKDQIRILLNKFHRYLENIRNLNTDFFKEDKKKKFLYKMNLFLKEEKQEIRTNSNKLIFNQERCQNIVYQLYKSADLRTNIRYLNDIDISTQLNVDDLTKNLKKLYDELR